MAGIFIPPKEGATCHGCGEAAPGIEAFSWSLPWKERWQPRRMGCEHGPTLYTCPECYGQLFPECPECGSQLELC